MADLIDLQRNEAWINPDGTPTLRFAEAMESLNTTSNSTTTDVELSQAAGIAAGALAGDLKNEIDNLSTVNSMLSAELADLKKQIKCLQVING